RVPFLCVLVAEVGVEDGSAPAHIAPVHPDPGKRNLVDRPSEYRFEHPWCVRRSMYMGQCDWVGHVSELEAVPAEIVLACGAALHRGPIIRLLSRKIVEV